jgi:uncharacterized protein YyaL (SSP411 family)
MSDSFVEFDTLRSRPRHGVLWSSWGRAAFERAAEERKPVLLAIGASWCHGCTVMDRTTYSVPEIVRTINDRCVPVRVDADRRPDINDRYNLDGWPTTAFLTASGEVLTGSTYVVPDQMARMLDEVTGGLARGYDQLMARADAAAQARRSARPDIPRYEPDADAPGWVVAQLLREQDSEFGGFGGDGKFLHAWSLRLALAQYEITRDERLAALLTRTLDVMAWGGIFDEVDGGFFRYAAGREWTRPHTEKMLEDQAAMVGLLIEASQIFERASWRERARDVMRYVQRTLADGTRGGFFASQRADEEYYAVNASIRETLDPPVVDRTLFTDLNAQAAVAWLRAGEALEDVEAGRFAVQSLERVLLATYKPGEGVAHYHDASGEVRGLLSDQVHAAWALLHVHDATGDETYLMLAEELARTALRTHWDRRDGGFLDHAPGGADDVGLLADPVKPLVLNCLAARMLSRIATLTGRGELQARALETLGSQTGAYRALGIGGAAYALAIMDVLGW